MALGYDRYCSRNVFRSQLEVIYFFLDSKFSSYDSYTSNHINVRMMPVPLHAPAVAAQCGHLHVLQWLQAHHCRMVDTACSRAASGSHLEVLNWLHCENVSTASKWEKSAERAARYGHLDVLN